MGRGRIIFIVVAAMAAALAAAPGAGAQTPDVDRWNCRASAGYIEDARTGARPIEPVIADGVPEGSTSSYRDVNCADERGGANVGAGGTGTGAPGRLDASGAFARVDASPDFGETHVQTIDSEAGVASVRIASPSGFLLTAGVARAQVTGNCQGGGPAVDTAGEVANVTINGTSISGDATFEQIGLGINGGPLGGRIRVFFNEVTREVRAGGDEEVVRRAIRVSILDAAGTEVFRAVVGEARVGIHLDVCSPPAHNCPAGATFDEAAGVCVITVVTTGPCPEGTTPTTENRCLQTIVLGPPSDQPSGGSVVVLDQVRSAGPCREPARRFGSQVAIVGTSRGDRITGSNKSDRIFTFAGNDRVSGGRGNECIEGGRGSDQLDGSNGSDWLFGEAGNDILTGGQRGDRLEGGTGNDKISGGTLSDRLTGGPGRDRVLGGAGNDRIDGGSGNDLLHTGNGRDRVRGGSGNDTINAATAGPPASIDCGPGFDTVRINYNERRRIRGCERVFVISLVR